MLLENLQTEIVTILNTPTLNLLPTINLKKIRVEKDLITGSGYVDLGNGKLCIQNFNLKKDYLKPSVFKVIDFLIIEIGKQNEYKLKVDKDVNTKLYFSIKEFGEFLGKKNLDTSSTKKEVRSIVNDSLALLNDFSISTKEGREGKIVEFNEMKFIDSFHCKNSVYEVIVNEKFTRYLLSSYVIKAPTKLFTLDMRNRNAYAVGKKLVYHQSNNSNLRRKRSEIIGVETLLKNCPDLPSIEEVRQNNGGWNSRIADKLEAVLDKLVDFGILERLELCNAKGKALTDYQLEMKTYFEFIKLRVKFKIRGLGS